VERFLASQADAAAPFVTELYADDMPFFGHGFPECTDSFRQVTVDSVPDAQAPTFDRESLLAVVRRGERVIPPAVAAAAEASAANCREARHVARNPFAGWAQ
jgi:hypothetical protein